MEDVEDVSWAPLSDGRGAKFFANVALPEKSENHSVFMNQLLQKSMAFPQAVPVQCCEPRPWVDPGPSLATIWTTAGRAMR